MLNPRRLIPTLLGTLPLLPLATGCLGTAASPAANGSPAPTVESGESAIDAAPRQIRQLALRVFSLELPRGQVSSNAELWRRIDEQAVAPGVYDVLYANGVRVGVAPTQEIEHLSQTLGIDEAPSLDVIALSLGRQEKELPIASGVEEQTLFWFDSRKRHKGETFLNCDNLLNLVFEPTPGRQTTMRLTLTPVVRSRRTRTVITPGGDDYQASRVRDETLFDLALRADVPFGWFLIVSPSEELEWETSLGRQFFTVEKNGELYERVYVIIPRINSIREG